MRSFPTPSSFPIAAPYFEPNAPGQGRPLTAGFHLMQGYFRDDGPLCDLILDDGQRRELDRLWDELNFITLAPMRQYKDFIFFERAEPPRFMREAEFDFARSEDKDATSEAKMNRLAKAYLAKARKLGASDEALKAIEDLFRRHVGGNSPGRAGPAGRRAEAISTRWCSSPSAPIAGRLSAAERDDLLAFYRKLRREDDLGHEEALRDTLVSVLMSPHFCYRFDLAENGHSRAAAVGLRVGQPAELFPLVEHARRRAAGPRRGGRSASAGRADGPGAADAARPAGARPGDRVRRQLARLPPLRGAQRRGSRTVPKLHQRTADRRCSRSRFATSSMWRSGIARYSTCSTATTPS